MPSEQPKNIQLTRPVWPGDPILKTPTPLNDLCNTYRVWHRDEPGRVVAEFYGTKAKETAEAFCLFAGE